MKIVHLSLRGPYTDNWGYQDNIMPRVQKRFGHDVTVIASCTKFSEGGKELRTEPGRYTLDDGVKVIRIDIPNVYPIKKLNLIFTPYKLLPLLNELKPDLLYVHGLGSHASNKDVKQYIQQNRDSCTLVGDVHASPLNTVVYSKRLTHKVIIACKKRLVRLLFPYYHRVFGVAPACLDFAEQYYGVPSEKLELLPLGYDPALCQWDDREKIRADFRKTHGLKQDEIVIIHGGKIEERRKTPETIKAVRKLNNPAVKLVIFGGVSDTMKTEVMQLIEENKNFVTYLGKLTQEEYYKAYLASDVALFPGGQSVLWQESIGCGLPLIVGNANKLSYLDRGGNAAFIDDISVDGITEILVPIINEKKYTDMRKVAEKEGREYFSYERIAQKVIDCADRTESKLE